MGTEEIVSALSKIKEIRVFGNDKTQLMSDAADLIEQLNDFEHSQCAKLLARIAELEAQLSESQRREQAAVEDFEGCMKNKKERCAYCIHDDECEPGESLCYANVCGFEWRGPEAGKGGK